MAAAVDYCPASVPPVAGAGGSPSEFSCNACSEAFESGAAQRAHCKTERHIYNTKRRLAGLKPISVEAWERKLKESRNAAAGKQENKGTSHLKAGKTSRSKANSDATGTEDGSFVPPSRTLSEQPAVAFEEAVFSPRRSLFDRKHFDDREENLNYMQKQYNFSIPDREYCTDVDGLLKALFEKINKPPHACLCCNRKFADSGAVRRHMQDMAHCRIGSLARTRRGGKDERGTEELQAELEDFYDFTASTREVTERITTPKDKAACLHRFFDADRDGFLDHVEVSALYYAAQTFAAQGSSTSSSSSTTAESEGTASKEAEEEEPPLLDEAIYKGACAKTGADPEEGLDPEALFQVYTEGLADLDVHFAMLQDALTKKLLNRSKARMEALEEEDGEDDDDEEEDEEEEEDDEEGDEEDSDSDSTEILECDDEDEFEEVMRILGLQKVQVLETGDIRLPSGKVAVHRNVAHIYKQHLGRFSDLVVANNNNSKATRGRPVLALSNGAASQINMSQRERTKENRKVIAVIKKQARSDLWLGMKANKMQRKCLKIRTGMGDASGGR
mmetsp:Transcript_81147/g.178291  ORF Transcript_81147/g.178291 Transcript_81147/m.178291 type:complete len:560 (-) Transcript_81147:188-1867(-)|eukprot:CAMPEP_0206457496 /NCGR_PEP_ID=MMETSP0324_2-20121206/22996_1 /ASSEMBLY_ACC=CAM_ASM_000836 /TAXON_ID=2866 /ORGANISM="Crypthecodinium cohnii, Strain Seligo" /LENGTH=559 /DNA_ID=CAMNT_0053928629 /DNA_START=81 /DNA_END=1760 /DNA_ORIENTATION=+